MPKPIKFTYEKKAPYRDAFYFIIVCEGTNREPDYFHFFNGMSSRVKVVPVANTKGSAPGLLPGVALAAEKELDASAVTDRVWFVIDTDRWREQLHEIRQACNQHAHWRVAQSNPCFEVWLYFHAKAQLAAIANIDRCSSWKPYLPTVIKGGFNPDIHPAAIETAIVNSKQTYQAQGYLPMPGCTQLWMLAQELLSLIQADLARIKHQFPAPVIIE